ncbi:hypothetical protein KOI35_04985 [Actinoplanes bogorensis]|uniref:DUF4352 domain-containing protein n=1 Tax=Paractinoplanes bogorensis TaxID=1610840 RepID=A0ABS5YHM3_9ACTN|nr:hypothetical protein [Actinoplanes bogorensis]MBU2662857.1 hypothetical protein [Actinoplanes bogorensis]
MTEFRAPSVRRPIWPWLLALVAALGVGAAGGWAAASSRSEAVPAAQVVTAPSSPSAASSAASPSPTTPPATKALKLGQTHSFTDSEGYVAAVTALAHRRADDVEGVQVRTCNRGKIPFTASERPWLLSYDDGEQLVDVTVIGGGLPSPAFVERSLAEGKCAKGWIAFEAPATGSPDGIEYRIEGTTSARWVW